jgi:hypothetical protein
MEKAKWFYNYNSPVIFGLDDLHNSIYKVEYKFLHPKYDFGYGGLKKNSIFKYFERNLLEKYPEIKYTIFLVFDKHSSLMSSKYAKNLDIYATNEFKELIRYIITTGNEIAYHGHHHGLRNATYDKKTWCREFDDFTNKEDFFEIIKSDLFKFEEEFGYKIKGGRSPCYMWRDDLIESLINLGFKWWSFDYKPFVNNIELKYKGYNIIGMPSNISGGIFNISNNYLKDIFKKFRLLNKIHNMLKNGEVISIAEHFMTSRIDGKRQTPNVYDDINSLDFIFGYLRNKNVWYATFSEVAEYFYDYNHTKIIKKDKNIYELKNDKKYKPFLTIISDSRFLLNLETQKKYEGIMKDNKWLFNDLEIGIYKELDE